MKLTVVIPVFNCAPWLRECLDSVLRSLAVREPFGFDCAEVICVDDGSTDGSGEILDEYASRLRASRPPGSPDFIVRHQVNQGVSISRNDALDIATGDWVTFVDGDDCVSVNRFSVVMKTIAEHPGAELVRLKHIENVREGEPIPRRCDSGGECPVQAEIHRGRDARDWGCSTFAISGWTVKNFVRRDVIGGLRFPERMRVKEDVVFFLKIARDLDYAVDVDYAGYYYRRRDGSALMGFPKVEDSVRFATEMVSLEHVPASVITGRLLFDALEWAVRRDWTSGYDAGKCPLLAVWRRLRAEGRIDLRHVRVWWRVALWLWMKWGWLGGLRWMWTIRRSFSREPRMF